VKPRSKRGPIKWDVQKIRERDTDNVTVIEVAGSLIEIWTHPGSSRKGRQLDISVFGKQFDNISIGHVSKRVPK